MLHVYSHENYMLELWILKLHRKTSLQQTPSSDAPTAGTPIPFFFFYLIWRSRLKKKFPGGSLTSCILEYYRFSWYTILVLSSRKKNAQINQSI